MKYFYRLRTICFITIKTCFNEVKRNVIYFNSMCENHICNKQFDKCIKWYLLQEKHPDKCLVNGIPLLCASLLDEQPIDEETRVMRFALIKLLLKDGADPNIAFENPEYREKTNILYHIMDNSNCDTEIAHLLFKNNGKIDNIFCGPHNYKGIIRARNRICVINKCLYSQVQKYNTNTPRSVYLLMKYGADPNKNLDSKIMAFYGFHNSNASQWCKLYIHMDKYDIRNKSTTAIHHSYPCWFIIEESSPERAFGYIYNTPSGELLTLTTNINTRLNDNQKTLLKMIYLLDNDQSFITREKCLADEEYERIDTLASSFLLNLDSQR